MVSPSPNLNFEPLCSGSFFVLPSGRALIKAVIFDVDGTLVDSNDFHVKAWQRAFRHYGKELSYDELHSQIGKGGDQLMPVFCSHQELESYGAGLERLRGKIFTRDYLP